MARFCLGARLRAQSIQEGAPVRASAGHRLGSDAAATPREEAENDRLDSEIGIRRDEKSAERRVEKNERAGMRGSAL